jgi:hypothetical protein
MSKTEQRVARLKENKEIFVTKKEFKQVFDDFMKPRHSDGHNNVKGRHNYPNVNKSVNLAYSIGDPDMNNNGKQNPSHLL